MSLGGVFPADEVFALAPRSAVDSNDAMRTRSNLVAGLVRLELGSHARAGGQERSLPEV